MCGPQEARGRLSRALCFPPFAAEATASRCARGMWASSRAESASPARGARASSPPSGRRRPHRCQAAELAGSSGGRGTRTSRGCVPLIPESRTPGSQGAQQMMLGSLSKELVTGTKPCVGSQAFRSPRGHRLGRLLSTSRPQGLFENCSEAECLILRVPLPTLAPAAPRIGFGECASDVRNSGEPPLGVRVPRVATGRSRRSES